MEYEWHISNNHNERHDRDKKGIEKDRKREWKKWHYKICNTWYGSIDICVTWFYFSFF